MRRFGKERRDGSEWWSEETMESIQKKGKYMDHPHRKCQDGIDKEHRVDSYNAKKKKRADGCLKLLKALQKGKSGKSSFLHGSGR